jgi:hypothetical protein
LAAALAALLSFFNWAALGVTVFLFVQFAPFLNGKCNLALLREGTCGNAQGNQISSFLIKEPFRFFIDKRTILVLIRGMKYLVLIGDVLGSKQLPERAHFQRRLKAVLHGLNSRRKTIVSPYTLTLGDEFQAVYRDAPGAFVDIFSLLAQIAPVQARFSLAVGDILTPINSHQSIGMDGPAFHHARARLEKLKGQGRLLGLYDNGDARWRLPASLLAVLSGLIEGWRPKRLQLFAGVLSGASVPELARQTGITTRAVNKNIRAADLDEWKHIVDEISRLLSEEIKAR